MPKPRDILKAIGEARDPILVAVSGTYALGFLVWSVHARHQGLGLLPIANTRYFIAGLPILFTLVVTYSLLHSRRWLKEWALRNAPRRILIMHLLTFTAMLATALLMSLLDVIARTAWSLLKWELFVEFKLLVFTMFLTLMLVVSDLPVLKVGNSKSKVIDWFIRKLCVDDMEPQAGKSKAVGRGTPLMHWVIRPSIIATTLVLASGLIELVNQVYPTLPLEFGGFRPRVAVLHLRVSDMSPSLRLILLAQPDDKGAEIRESKEVLVFYADTERLIVKVRPGSMHSSATGVHAPVADELPIRKSMDEAKLAAAVQALPGYERQIRMGWDEGKLAAEVQAAPAYELRTESVRATTYLK